MFRIKKCPAVSFENELSEKIKMRNEENEKNRSAKNCMPLKEEWKHLSSETGPGKIKSRDLRARNVKNSQRYLKKMEKSTNLFGVDPWDYDEREGMELF